MQKYIGICVYNYYYTVTASGHRDHKQPCTYPLKFELFLVPEWVWCWGFFCYVMPVGVGWKTEHFTLSVAVGLLFGQEEPGDDLRVVNERVYSIKHA